MESKQSVEEQKRFNTVIGKDVAVACEWLKKGEAIGMPTETVYGLAANALNADAAFGIFRIKNRPSFDPLIVHLSSVNEVEKYVTDFPKIARHYAEKLWPGPLTLLLPKKDIVPDIVTSGLDRVALRVPAHPTARELLRELSFPLAAPSANPFGYISPTTAQHVMDQLGTRIPYILDGGDCRVGVESTIIGFDEGEEGDVVVYRLGGVSVEDVEALSQGRNVRVELNQSSNPTAPGMLKSHYAPKKPINVIDAGTKIPSKERLGLISLVSRPCDAAFQIPLCGEGVTQVDVTAAARNVFAALRAMDACAEVEEIYAELCPAVGLGRAVNDRLGRASVKSQKNE